MTASFSEKKLFIIDAYGGMYDFYKEKYPQYANVVKSHFVGAIQYSMGELLNIKGRELYKKYGKDVRKKANALDKKGLPLKSKLFLFLITSFPSLYGILYKIFKQ